MHLGKFHYTVYEIEADIRSNAILQKLQSLIQLLTQVAANPGNPSIQQNFKNALEEIRQALGNSIFNNPYPTLESMLNGIDNAREFLGLKLFERIKIALQDSQFTAQLATNELSEIFAGLQKFYNSIKQINDAFEELEIEWLDLEPGGNELGISIPVVEGSKTLKDLSIEAKDWHNALQPFSELFGQNNEQIKLRVMSSSDWQFYLLSTAGVLLGISTCIFNLNLILSNLVKTKKLIKELISSGTDPESIKPLEESTNVRFKNEAKALAEKMVEENYKLDDTGRKNELKIAVSQSIIFLANKLTKNVRLEIRMELPTETKSPTEDEEDAPTQERAIHYDELKQIKQQIDANMSSAVLELDGVDQLLLQDEVTELELDIDKN